MYNYEFLLRDISTIKGIGSKTTKLFKKKNINTIFDLIWSLPRNFTDRTHVSMINELQIGKVCTVVADVKKYNFLRARRLPNRVNCVDNTGEIDCIFFTTIN